MRYIIFTRVSTGKQRTENQIHECLTYVREKMGPKDEMIQFDERNVSTRKSVSERPVLRATIDYLKKGDTLVVYKLNRLARAGNELVWLWHDLTKKGVNLVSLYEKQVDEMMIHAYAMVGQAERRNIRESTKSALNRKKSKMEKVGRCLYGYTTDPEKLQKHNPDVPSFGKPYILIPEENENAQVDLMLKLFQEGLNYAEITHALASRGFLNRKGNPVHKMTVYRVLKRINRQNQAPKDLAYG